VNARRAFGCGIDPKTFKAKYESLQEQDRDRLERVATRLWLTLKLRYETTVYASLFAREQEEFALTNTELPSMEIYLLCTCLDTLAGKTDYKDFGDWLRAHQGTAYWNVDTVLRSYDCYKDEYGVGRNLRRLFDNLAQDVRVWLADNVVIRQSDQPLVIVGQDVTVLVKWLYIYIYEVWRNKYTHSSISQLTSVANDVTATAADGSWWITPAACTHFVLHRDRPNQKWDLSYRRGLDLATILRVIIHGAALHQVLGIEPTQHLISANLRSLSRLSALYAFVREVNMNSSELDAWSQIDNPGLAEFQSLLFHGGVPELQTGASKIMVSRYDGGTNLESGLCRMTLEYLSEVNCLNETISEFNVNHPPSQTGLSDRWTLIKDFLKESGETATYHRIRGWPSKKQMTNVWLVIRDPCYT
jgi:hypothetical protein